MQKYMLVWGAPRWRNNLWWKEAQSPMGETVNLMPQISQCYRSTQTEGGWGMNLVVIITPLASCRLRFLAFHCRNRQKHLGFYIIQRWNLLSIRDSGDWAHLISIANPEHGWNGWNCTHFTISSLPRSPSERQNWKLNPHRQAPSPAAFLVLSWRRFHACRDSL